VRIEPSVSQKKEEGLEEERKNANFPIYPKNPI